MDVPVRDIAHPVVSRRNVERMVDVPVAVSLVLDQLVPQRSVQQVVHAHVPPAAVSGRIAQQVIDVPVPCVAPGFARVPQHETPLTRAAAAWLDAPQEQFEGWVFALFPGPKKVRMSPRSRVRTWARTPAHPRRLPRLGGRQRWCLDGVGGGARHVSGSTCARDAPSGTRRGSAEPCRCWWCTGSRAWHPLAPSWVPLPTPGQVKQTGVQGVQFQDKWLMACGHVVAGSAAGELSTEAVEEFHILSTRSWTLDIFDEPMLSGSHLPRCSHVSLRFLSEFHPPAARREKVGHYFYKPLVFSRCDNSVQCLALQWIHVLRQCPGAYGVEPTFSMWW